MTRRAGGVLLLVAALLAAAASAQEPRREDRGDLVVLHVYGSYREMGRQQADLLGPVLRAVYELQLASFHREIAARGFGARIFDHVYFPLASWAGRQYESSGFHHEMRGTADALRERPRDVMRALFNLTGASTAFAATGAATADGAALIGRNVDWPDAGGRRRPVLTHYHPSNGDLDHILVSWPLLGIPTAGLNSAGFALSFNYFETDPQVSLWFPHWPHRRALQTATSVEEGIRIFLEAPRRGISCFMVMADAGGEIAMVECSTSKCGVFRPEGDWFAQANHAQTEEMIPFDLYRSPDSFARLEGMRSAVRAELSRGALTPAAASRILRDRSTSPFANASNVGNLTVLNALVVHPASRTLWHSTTMQPYAPFGEYVPFSPTRDPSGEPALPASPRLGSAELAREAAAVERAREALRRLLAGEAAASAAQWDALAADPEVRGVIEPHRLDFERARARWTAGDLAGAYATLESLESPEAPFDARAFGLLYRGLLADRLGRREEAVRLYTAAREHVESAPEYNLFGQVLELSAAGLDAPQRGPLPPYRHWSRIPP